MHQPYVDYHDGGYWIRGSRVSLDSIVHCFREGQTAQAILQAFPVLSLASVYGAIAYYLTHRDAVDSYLEKAEVDYEAVRQGARQADSAFYQKLADARG